MHLVKKEKKLDERALKVYYLTKREQSIIMITGALRVSMCRRHQLVRNLLHDELVLRY